jgi:septal ring factor EnvC (AmiA/AmiB activator)
MGTFEIFVLVLAVLVLIVKGYTTRDLAKARERLAEQETESKRLRGQLKVIQFERAPITNQLKELGKTLSSQNNQILEMQTQLGKIADENTQLKEKSGKK